MPVVNQKRIAVNTLLLYVRMGLVLIIGLYTTRVVLGALGKAEYGLYGTIGSLVILFSFLSNSMSTACQRFFSYELGRGDICRVRNRFTQCFLTFVLMAVAILILFETIGLWYVRNIMECDGRDRAVSLVYQYTIAGVIFQVLRTPYMGMLIAKEKMSAFAVINIFEALATLCVAFLLKSSDFDRLVFYALLMAAVQAFTALLYFAYGRLFLEECRFSGLGKRKSLYEVFRFTGWEMIGTLAGACKFQGVSLLLNPLFGNVAVAARTVSQKVYMSVVRLQDDFFKAVKPQIIKSYAAEEKDEMMKLLFQSTRFSFYLMLMVSLPIIIETPFILNIWLGEEGVPELSIVFTRLILINGLIDVFSNPLATAIQATGNNKWYQICMGGTLFAILPVGYLGMKCFDWSAVSIFYVSIMLSVIAQFVRVYFVRRQVGLNVPHFLKEVVEVIIKITLMSALAPMVLKLLLGKECSLTQSLLIIVVSVIWTGIVVYFFGVTGTERKHLNEFIVKTFHKVVCRR